MVAKHSKKIWSILQSQAQAGKGLQVVHQDILRRRLFRAKRLERIVTVLQQPGWLHTCGDVRLSDPGETRTLLFGRCTGQANDESLPFGRPIAFTPQRQQARPLQTNVHEGTIQSGVEREDAAENQVAGRARMIVTKNPKRTADDVLTVEIRDSAGKLLETLGTYSNLDASPTYLLQRFDVSAYRGKSIRVSFTGIQSQGPPTWFLLDDVALKIWR